MCRLQYWIKLSCEIREYPPTILQGPARKVNAVECGADNAVVRSILAMAAVVLRADTPRTSHAD
jgi:hypothetical protein